LRTLPADDNFDHFKKIDFLAQDRCSMADMFYNFVYLSIITWQKQQYLWYRAAKKRA